MEEGDLAKLKVPVRAGDLNSLKMLLSSCPSLSDSAYVLCHLLLLACVNGHREIISFLIQEKSVGVNQVIPWPNDGGYFKSPLQAAVESKEAAIVKLLVCDYHADVDLQIGQDHTALDISCRQGDVEILDILLSNSQKVDDSKYMHILLEAAVSNGYAKLVSCLLDRGAKIIHENDSILLRACEQERKRKRNVDVIRVLLQKGDDDTVNFRNGAALMSAMFAGNLELVELLLSYGANVNIITENGDSLLLHFMSLGGYNLWGIVKMILNKGADANFKNNDMKTPLMALIERYDPAIRLGGVNVLRFRHKFPLSHLAVLQLVELLLDYKVDVNFQETMHSRVYNTA